ncbi:MAG: hypothetical protein QOI86_2645, partial [Actinomycetota bacterium]|nr:hypothetical protein [Actinomycetota bacterium]
MSFARWPATYEVTSAKLAPEGIDRTVGAVA